VLCLLIRQKGRRGGWGGVRAKTLVFVWRKKNLGGGTEPGFTKRTEEEEKFGIRGWGTNVRGKNRKKGGETQTCGRKRKGGEPWRGFEGRSDCVARKGKLVGYGF